MDDKVYVNLHADELTIFNAAVEIFSSYVANQKLNAHNEQELIKKSVDLAISIANVVDERVESDG